jgi:hypothetical protein
MYELQIFVSTDLTYYQAVKFTRLVSKVHSDHVEGDYETIKRINRLIKEN